MPQAAQGATDVVLLASLVGDPICKKYPELAREVNEDGANAASSIGSTSWACTRFVFTSTCSNYGIHDSARLATENSELNPQSLYARDEDRRRGVPARRRARRGRRRTVLRIATAYGLSPRMRFDLTVSQFAWELATGRTLQVYDADTWRPYCHVRDIAQAIMTVLSAAATSTSAARCSTSATPRSSSPSG